MRKVEGGMAIKYSRRRLGFRFLISEVEKVERGNAGGGRWKSDSIFPSLSMFPIFEVKRAEAEVRTTELKKFSLCVETLLLVTKVDLVAGG